MGIARRRKSLTGGYHSGKQTSLWAGLSSAQKKALPEDIGSAAQKEEKEQRQAVAPAAA
jgi:hypothetical protein